MGRLVILFLSVSIPLMASDEVPDPVTALQAAAAQLHEMFLAWITAGFTEPQALELTKSVVAALAGRQ